MEKQKRKFTRLEISQKRYNPQCEVKVIVNLSKLPLDPAAQSILQKGFNYALTPKKIPVEEIISGVESAIGHLPPSAAEIVRQDACRILRMKSKTQKHNTTMAEREALRKLKENESIVILSADKGNATVVLEKEDYDKKMEDLLAEGPYQKIDRHPTARYNGIVKEIIKT
ncbi:uncharacterized protein LOC124163079 [Ischnura elegans]|uniref:uncharacterized protein LOC124163079 n=1 Tax=Ischnura elegans TaxID=197161 RepID=UPI001ED896A9|nr:uncharacterized protein LOC124163079 [Ischnura elegans]